MRIAPALAVCLLACAHPARPLAPPAGAVAAPAVDTSPLRQPDDGIIPDRGLAERGGGFGFEPVGPDDDVGGDGEPDAPSCGDSPDVDLASLDVALTLTNRGLGAGKPVEMTCESTWTQYCTPLAASACGTSGLAYADTTRTDQIPLEIIATTTATVTVDGTPFQLKGTARAADRRAVQLAIGKRHAQIRSTPGTRGGGMPIAYQIDGPAHAEGGLLVSMPGLIGELASWSGGKVRWAGEREADAQKAHAKVVLLVADGEIVDAYPSSAEVALGDVRYLGRLTGIAGDLCKTARATDPKLRTPHLVISDRVTGATVVDAAMPPLTVAGACTRDINKPAPRWVQIAYAPELGAAFEKLLTRTLPAWPTVDPRSAGKRAPLWRMFGTSAPTMAELARVLGGDRARLVAVAGSGYGGVGNDGRLLTSASISLDHVDRLRRLGLTDPVVALLGKRTADVLALLGPPEGPAPTPATTYLRYEVRQGDAKVSVYFTVADDVVDYVSITWSLAPDRI